MGRRWRLSVLRGRPREIAGQGTDRFSSGLSRRRVAGLVDTRTDRGGDRRRPKPACRSVGPPDAQVRSARSCCRSYRSRRGGPLRGIALHPSQRHADRDASQLREWRIARGLQNAAAAKWAQAASRFRLPRSRGRRGHRAGARRSDEPCRGEPEMKDFWLACGHHLLDRDEGGGLLLTDEFLKVYLARPELAPPSEACIVEKTLHAALLAEPRRHVTKDEIAAIADADARENWGLMIAFRDHLVKHRTLEAAYVDLVRKGVGSTPHCFSVNLS